MNLRRAADGGQVRPPAGVALGPWIRWLTDQQVVLFHGSPDGDITELLPRRTTPYLGGPSLEQDGRPRPGHLVDRLPGWSWSVTSGCSARPGRLARIV